MGCDKELLRDMTIKRIAKSLFMKHAINSTSKNNFIKKFENKLENHICNILIHSKNIPKDIKLNDMIFITMDSSSVCRKSVVTKINEITQYYQSIHKKNPYIIYIDTYVGTKENMYKMENKEKLKNRSSNNINFKYVEEYLEFINNKIPFNGTIIKISKNILKEFLILEFFLQFKDYNNINEEFKIKFDRNDINDMVQINMMNKLRAAYNQETMFITNDKLAIDRCRRCEILSC